MTAGTAVPRGQELPSWSQLTAPESASKPTARGLDTLSWGQESKKDAAQVHHTGFFIQDANIVSGMYQ